MSEASGLGDNCPPESLVRAGHGEPADALRPIAIAIAFALTGALFALHRLAGAILKEIVTPDPSLTFREVSDALPIPRKLDWNVPLIQTLSALRDVRGVPLIIVAAGLLVVLGVVYALLIRPARTADDPPADSDLPEAPAKPPTTDPVEGAADPAPQLVVHARLGANAALDPSADAAVATFAAAPSKFDRPRAAGARAQGVRSRGASTRARAQAIVAYMLCAAALAVYGAPSVSDTVLRYFRTLGTFNQDYFARIAWPCMLCTVSVWTASGLALCATFGAGRSRRGAGVAACALMVVAVVSYRAIPMRTAAAERDWTPAILTTVPPRSPLGVPDGPDAAEMLAKVAGLPLGSQPEQPDRTLLVFLGRRGVGATIEGVTEDGLTASPASQKSTVAFLAKRRYESALSWMAIKHSFAVSAIHFDTTAEIETCLTDMERCPHLAQCGQTVRNMLFTCSASPANLALLDRWADPSRYVCPTRESRRLMGQLFERFGQPAKALVWYRRADMPDSFLARVRTERPLFNKGAVTGAITLNGQPLAGAQVGVVPRRMNGLPLDLEPQVLRALTDVAALPMQQRSPPFRPVPFALRWISEATTTDGAGRFALSDLTEGEYHLVIALPPAVRTDSPRDPSIQVEHAPPPCTVGYKSPSRDLGTIAIRVQR